MTEQEEAPQQEILSEIEEPKTLSVGEMELESLREEARSYKDKYLRLLAESENARKRLQKDRKEIVQMALEGILLDFLHPIDHMENALGYAENMSEEVKHWAHGFKMILSQFRDVLASNGVKPMESVGKPFDPHHHEAIEMVPTNDQPEGTIVEEHMRGYSIGERTLRPARVKVAQAVVKEEINTKNEENNHDKEEK